MGCKTSVGENYTSNQYKTDTLSKAVTYKNLYTTNYCRRTYLSTYV